MKVTVRDKNEQKAIVGEMVGAGQVGELIGEMISEPTKLKDCGFNDEIVTKAANIKAAMNDDNAQFPVVRVEEGWSGSNRLWPATEIDSIVRQTNENEPVGNLGHIKPEDEASSFGDAQTTWLGAYAKDEPSKQKSRKGENVRVAYFVGYNHPGARIRTLIPSRAVRGISWWGPAEQIPIPGKGVEVRGFVLKALDWARKLSEGMPTSRIMSVTSEMENKMEIDLSQVTPEQLKREAPNLFTLVVSGAVAEEKKTIGEMEATISTLNADKDMLAEVRKLLKLNEGDDILDAISKAVAKLGQKAKAVLSESLDRVLKERIPGDDKETESRRGVLLGLLPKDAMVGEMENQTFSKSEDADKFVGEMVDKAINESSAIKYVIGEMQAPSVKRSGDLGNVTSSDVDKAFAASGMEIETRSVGA